MLVILLLCLMKLVNISSANRFRRHCDSKENRMQNGQEKMLPAHLYKQLQLYQHQKQQLEMLKQQKFQQILQYEQHLQRMQQTVRKNTINNRLHNKGIKSSRGMTEYPSNDKNKSRLPQLNHNSPHHHLYHNHYQQQQQQQQKLQQQHCQYQVYNSSHRQQLKSSLHSPDYQTPKNPLTSPNTTYNNYAFNHLNYNPYQNNDGRCFINHDNELTEEHLKRNVQIVLNNLDRYNSALRSIIIDEETGINYNNNFAMNNMLSSPESDYNSNPPHNSFDYINCSIGSSHDFTHDNDYQWFLDYGYRDGVAHQSVLSSLSASYNGIGELSYYEDLAKNIDVNLAEVDMENFRTEDIHSLLTNIPSMCTEKRRQEQNDLDNFICKSELLFSPVKESHISVDSLDLDSYPEDGDIILTCKANKDNYTIAFEGSALYSDESFYENAEQYLKAKQNYINLHSNLDDIVKRKSMEVSMSRSDHAFTTWSKLKKSSTSQLQRYPSGNNNTSVNIVTKHAPHCIVRKSSSLPNLQVRKENTRQLNVSQAISSSIANSYRKSRNLLPMCQMPISSPSEGESPIHNSTIQSSDSSSKQNQPAFNLVKLFIKQKSNSSDTCMDVSSGCWPSDASSSLEQRMRKKSMNDSGKGSALSRHDEEDGLESTYQLDSLDICEDSSSKDTSNNTPVSRKARNDLYREVFDSASHRNYLNECNNKNLNVRSHPLKNPQILNLAMQNNNNNNNNNSTSDREFSTKDKSLSEASRTSDNLTQVFCNHNTERMKIPVDMITQSVQTSFRLRDRFRVVPPSFLAQLNKLGEEKPAPVYVIYPNYALPDLGFVKTNLSDIVLSPLGYKETFTNKKPRPTSFTSSEEETMKDAEYKHIIDWKSLVTLLPTEYRRRLKNIPEADVDLDPMCSQRPLFCMTPPLRRTSKANTCDCSSYLQTTCTSSSGSSQPPSSGYRGSSTLLTDSEFETASGPKANTVQPASIGEVMKYMYACQHDVQRLENEIVERPPPSGGRTPRGILRRNNRSARSKRNSMFEEGKSPSSVRNLEKRRSLQEPYSPENHNLIEEYLQEIEENNSKQFVKGGLPMPSRFGRNITTCVDHNLIDAYVQKENDLDARIRAENFLSSVPKSELKYYAEIAHILESMDSNLAAEQYDRAKLKNEVSRALSQKKVSFNQPVENMAYLQTGGQQKFSTPPNSPNISVAALRVNNSNQRTNKTSRDLCAIEKEKQEKISSNRFKRLQIQWELLSKDSSVLLKDLARETETKSGGSTPTSTGSQRSRIPRPVSYPNSNKTATDASTNMRSPSRIVPPKKYSVAVTKTTTTAAVIPSANSAAALAITRPKTPNKLTNTPKKTAPTPRSATRTR